jgi:hypothetical protein
MARPEPPEASDAALLDRYVSGRDEDAFAALVERHGRLVLAVCRRVLGNGPSAVPAVWVARVPAAVSAATDRVGPSTTPFLIGFGFPELASLTVKNSAIAQNQATGVQEARVAPAAVEGMGVTAMGAVCLTPLLASLVR